FLKRLVIKNEIITQVTILSLTEFLYDELKEQAFHFESALNEFSCTFLGCVLYQDNSVFFQIGDGIIVRNDNSGNFTTIWLPQNGEYSNTTTFLIDDIYFGNLKFKELDEKIDEIALTTDGLQILILNNDTNDIHQPFFLELFKWLRLANSPEQIDILGKKLQDYISSDIINDRTDDDKTLILATRLNA
ncbi:MAG: protein phosphatase 2C domain-containing protein, partial [Ferruginibacter sp.]